MSNNIRLAYDKRSEQYMLINPVSDKKIDTVSNPVPLNEIDKTLDNAIRTLADAADKFHKFKLEQMKFLYMHRNDRNVAPELTSFNENYLSSLDKFINEAKALEASKRREVVEALKNTSYLSFDPICIFLFSFLSVISMPLMESLNDWSMESLSFDKENYITENINTLNFNEREVKIFLTEKDNRETVKIVADRETWDNLAYNQEYQKMLTDKDTRTSVYSLSTERFTEIEKGLKASTSAKDYLDDKLGGPTAIKQKGDFAECMKIDAMNVGTIEKLLSKFVKDKEIFAIKSDGRFARLQKGEKISILNNDGNVSVDVCKGIGKNGNETLLFGNLKVKDELKIDQATRAKLSRIRECHILPFRDADKPTWMSVTPNCIPDKIKGHLVSKAEKEALLKGEVVMFPDCKESSKKEYEASVSLSIQKTPIGIKPVLKVAPKGFKQMQINKKNMGI
ncbi:MAG: hypothetical protein IKV67_00035 [Paludibacteraceae bacterium]|nr:hypothetical protein [Paludibacteraceae bacterium]